MNYLKSGWSFLSSSFTQAEEDDLDEDSPTSAQSEELVSAAESQRRGSVDSVEDLIEFADAEDIPPIMGSDAQHAQYESENSQEPQSTPNEFGGQLDHFKMESPDDQSSSVDGVLVPDVCVDNDQAIVENIVEGVVGYTSLEASDSDDSGEYIPSAAAPVGPSVNTASQLDAIIDNLGGDLGILSLEEENRNEATFTAEVTVGNTFYQTAYDQTLCPSSPDETIADTLAVTAIEADLGAGSENSSFDSAFASSSKSSNLSTDSVKLNLNSDCEAPQEKNTVEATTEELLDKTHADQFPSSNAGDEEDPSFDQKSPVLNRNQQDESPHDTLPSDENPFQESFLNSTVQEVDIESEAQLPVQADFIISPAPQNSSEKTTEPVVESQPASQATEDKIELPVEVKTATPTSKPEEVGSVEATPVVSQETQPDQAEKPVVNETAVLETQPETAQAKTECTEKDSGQKSPSFSVENQASSSSNNHTVTKMDDPTDEIPLACGAYNLDFDNIDSFNPFQCNKALQNSPEKAAKPFAASIENTSKPCQDETAISEKLPNGVEDLVAVNNVPNNLIAPESTPPERTSVPLNMLGGGDAGSVPQHDVDVSINDANANLENVDPSFVKPAKKAVKKPLGKKVTRPVKKKPLASIATPAEGPVDSDDVIIPRGAYTIDFDNLDNFDPFKSAKAMSNSPMTTVPSTGFCETEIEQQEQAMVMSEDAGNQDGESKVLPDKLEYMEIEPVAKEEPSSLVLEDPQAESAVEETSAEPAAVGKSLPSEPVPSEPTGLCEESNTVGEDEGMIPVSKGAYSLDLDNLDKIDPFKTSKGLANSPTKPAPSGYTVDLDNLDEIDPFKPSKAMANSPPASPSKSHPPQAPEPAVLVDDTVAAKDAPAEVPSEVNSAPVVAVKGDECPTEEKLKTANATTPQKLKKKPKSNLVRKKRPDFRKPAPVEENGNEDIPVPKGSYNLDFDNLDSMDPFKTSKGLSNSPTKEAPTSAYSLNFDELGTIDPFKPSKAMANSPPASPTKDRPDDEDSVPVTAAPEDAKVADQPAAEEAEQKPETEAQTAEPKPEQRAAKQPTKKGLARKKMKPSLGTPAPQPGASDQEELPVSKGAYNLDFDNLDSMDPFKSSKGIPNSPTKTAPSGYSVNFDDLDSIDPFKSSKAMANSPPGSPAKAVAAENMAAEGVTDSSPPAVMVPQKDTEKDEQFVEEKPPDDENKTKPSAPVVKKKKIPSGLARRKITKPRPKPVAEADNAEDELPVPKGAYNLDFDNLDAMDPFKTSKGLPNSPTKETPPAAKSSYAVDDLDSVDPFKPSKAMANSPPSSPGKMSPAVPEAEVTTSVTASKLSDPDPLNGAACAATEQPVSVVVEGTESNLNDAQLRKMEFDRLNETEEFHAASDVFQDCSLDYFDTLNTQPLTKSELRKQSLYVKFDPLVSDSPEPIVEARPTVPDSTPKVEPRLPPSVESDPATDDRQTQEGQTQVLINDIDPPGKPQVQSNASKGSQSAMDSFTQPYLSQQSYQPASPSLQYTQADLDKILRKEEAKWEAERKEAKAKEESLSGELAQMNQVVKEYEQLFSAISKNENGTSTREQQLAKAEHEQSLEDLAALERSHDDLSRRYNKLKSVVAQFKQNEDILKKAATEMMEEAKMAREKYVALKNQTDEESAKVNRELKQVKANAQQEVARAQAQLKMLELKCDSLQSQIRDCNNENEELTKLCDELITCSKQAQG